MLQKVHLLHNGWVLLGFTKNSHLFEGISIAVSTTINGIVIGFQLDNENRHSCKENHFLVNRKLIDTFLRAPLSRSVCVCQNIAKWGGWYNNIIWKEGTHNNNFQSQFPFPADLIWTCAKAHIAAHRSFWLAKQPLLDRVTWISHWNILLLQDNPQFHRRPLLPPLCVSCGFVRWRSRLCAINLCIYSNSGLCGFVDKVKTGQDRTACCRARASVQVSTFEIVNWEDCLIKLAAPAKFVSVAVQSSRNERGGLACRNFVQLFIRLLVVVTMSCVVSGRMLKVLRILGKRKWAVLEGIKLWLNGEFL